jgi:hypothetical protein
MTNNFYILNDKLYTKVDISSNYPIIEFKGKVQPSSNLDFFSRLEISSELSIGPSGDIDDHINHSCNPNTGLRVVHNRAFLYSIKNIKANQEITFDFSTTMLDGKYLCKCNFGNCRKFIEPFKSLDKQIKDKYISLNIVPKFILEREKHV